MKIIRISKGIYISSKMWLYSWLTKKLLEESISLLKKKVKISICGVSEINTAKKKLFKFSLKKIIEKFFTKKGIPGINRRIIYIIKGSLVKNGFLFRNFFNIYLVLVTIKKLIIEPKITDNKETIIP